MVGVLMSLLYQEDTISRFSFSSVNSMASKSSKWSIFASRVFCLLIILQIPLFRFPCRIGICRTPVELTCSQLIATEVYPATVVKSLLYPGAIAKAIVNHKPIPSFKNLLRIYNLENAKNARQRTDLQHIDVLIGSYLAVVGAILGPFRRGRRLGMIGILLIIWGISRKPILVARHAFGDDDDHKDFSRCYPTMVIAVVSGFFSIRGDARRVVSFFKWTFGKTKYK